MPPEEIDPKRLKANKKTILSLYPKLKPSAKSTIPPLLGMENGHLATTKDSQNYSLWTAFCALGFATIYMDGIEIDQATHNPNIICFQTTPFGQKMIPVAIELAMSDDAKVAASITAAGADFLLGQTHYVATHEYDKAFAAYTAGAENGSHAAQFMLGVMYQNGHYVTQSDQTAYAFYQKAAQGASTSPLHAGGACLRISILYEENKVTGDKDNETEAFEWLKRSAELGNAQAMAFLFLNYTKGIGTVKNTAEARRWLKSSAEKGYKDAARKLYEICLEEENNEDAYLYGLLAQINGENMDDRLKKLDDKISSTAKNALLHRAIEIEFSYAD